jgi:DNA polymerase
MAHLLPPCRVLLATAAPLVPPEPTLEKLRDVAKGCRACPLWKTGTQTVFGEGPARARVLVIGEIPGHEEDLAGRPFVGPAGRVLDDAMQRAGLKREDVYVTNAVKHFKWEARGKRRLHKKPAEREIAACRPWLEAEIDVIAPDLIVCLGATAAQAILGKQFRVTQQRGQLLSLPNGRLVVATIHPSAILRMPDPEVRRQARVQFHEDIKRIAGFLRKSRKSSRVTA